MIFFTLVVWILAQDGEIDRLDGITLIGLFLFWQCFHIYEVLKDTAIGSSGWHPMIIIDLALILIGSWLTLFSVESVVSALLAREEGFLSSDQLVLLTGWLMVLPNAVLAFYYAIRDKGDVVYSSQIGDSHICIPLCIGLFAAFYPIQVPRIYERRAALYRQHRTRPLDLHRFPKKPPPTSRPRNIKRLQLRHLLAAQPRVQNNPRPTYGSLIKSRTGFEIDTAPPLQPDQLRRIDCKHLTRI